MIFLRGRTPLQTVTLVAEVIGVLAIGAALFFWAASVSFTAVNAERDNDRQDVLIQRNSDKIDTNQKENNSLLYEINGRTIRIEEALKHR